MSDFCALGCALVSVIAQSMALFAMYYFYFFFCQTQIDHGYLIFAINPFQSRCLQRG